MRLLLPGLVLLALLAPAYLAQEAPAAEAERLIERLDGLPPAHVPAPGVANGIGPGSRLAIEIPGEGTFGCTANFVWESGGRLYLGAAGHCFVPADRTATHGVGADYDARDVKVHVCSSSCLFGGQSGFLIRGGMDTLGRVAYARQSGPVGSDSANDFGLVEIPLSLAHKVRPALPVWGGPTTSEPAAALGALCLYGNSMGFGEAFATMARVGLGTNEFIRDSWTASLPVTFGDSGAALVTCEPDAGGIHGTHPVGVITHGVPGLASGPTVARAMALAAEAGLDIALVSE